MAAATIAPGTAISRPSTTAGTSTWRPEAPRLRASAIVARRRRAASTAISPSVATPTSAGSQRHDGDDPLGRRPAGLVRLEHRGHPGAQRGVAWPA